MRDSLSLTALVLAVLVITVAYVRWRDRQAARRALVGRYRQGKHARTPQHFEIRGAPGPTSSLGRDLTRRGGAR